MKRLSAAVAFSAHLLLSCSDKDIATNPDQPAGKRVSSPTTVSAPVQAVNNLAKKQQEERAPADSLRDAVEGDTTRRFIAGPIRSLTSTTGYAGLTPPAKATGIFSWWRPTATNLRRLTSDSASDVHPSWSPDGRHIAFTSARDGEGEIYVMAADGSNLRGQLTSDTPRQERCTRRGRPTAATSPLLTPAAGTPRSK